MIACCIYAIARLVRIDVAFSQLTTVFSRLYPDNGPRMKYNLSLAMEGVPATSNTQGNLIDFYNKVFVTLHNDYLGELQRYILC